MSQDIGNGLKPRSRAFGKAVDAIIKDLYKGDRVIVAGNVVIDEMGQQER